MDKNCKLTIGFTYSILASVLFLCSCSWNGPQSVKTAYANLPDHIDFNYHVKPILSDKCFSCHGPDENKRKVNLRFDLEGSTAVKAGNVSASLLVDRILSENDEEVMPPPDSKLRLDDTEKATLIKWIEQGAKYKKHWSFIRPEKGALPDVKSPDWCKNEIDYFVMDKLEQLNIQPNTEATKETLIRRLYFTLTGLPPTVEQIQSFVKDSNPNAYDILIDRLLEKEEYGERMAADWMDVARYADSDGYLDDKHRDFSPYRDWVIDAFNHNMSYEDFATHQLAGDLIQHADQNSILATAFNRLHKKNSEAGIIYEEYRQEYVADKTATLGKAFLGLTLECARCHDHKYDAISQKNYYEMAAYFNSTNEIGTAVYGTGQIPGPSLLLTNQKQDEILAFIDKSMLQTEQQIIDSRNELHPINEKITVSRVKETLKHALISHYALEKLTNKKDHSINQDETSNHEAAKVKEGQMSTKDGQMGVFISDYTTIGFPDSLAWFDLTDPFSISLNIYPDEIYQEVGILYHCEDFRLGLNGYSMHLENNKLKFIMAQSWPSNAIEIVTEDALAVRKWSNVTITYDGLGKAAGFHIYFNGRRVETENRIDNLYKSILFEPNIHTYGFHGLQLGLRDKMKTFMKGGFNNLKIFSKELSGLEVKVDFESEIEEMPEILVRQHIEINNPALLIAKDSLRNLLKRKISLIDTIPEIMVLGDLPEARPTYLLERGMYDSPSEEVFPSVPSAVLPIDPDLPKNRLGLTTWLFDNSNPLTARVYVNRLWQMHFGKGLVASSDDFGNQGDLPTHPELLDWLAVQFMESGWDIKAMHKLILMSSTFRQSSKTSPEILELDPYNDFLARGPKNRMTAEMIRDNALAISGLLVSQKKGESTYPYQPEGLWDEISNKSWRYKYLQEPGDGLYRRSLYSVWKRTSPPPSMLIFDVAERGACTVKRRSTSTPLQALVLLNDPQFVEACLVLSDKLLTQEENAEDRLKVAFHVSTGRQATDRELQILSKFHSEEKARFTVNESDASAYISNGNSSYINEVDSIELAALATVINGIMNTSDGYTLR